MGMKQGGVSYNSHSAKRGMESRAKCKHCSRVYKQEWTKNTHEKKCKEFNKEVSS